MTANPHSYRNKWETLITNPFASRMMAHRNHWIHSRKCWSALQTKHEMADQTYAPSWNPRLLLDFIHRDLYNPQALPQPRFWLKGSYSLWKRTKWSYHSTTGFICCFSQLTELSWPLIAPPLIHQTQRNCKPRTIWELTHPGISAPWPHLPQHMNIRDTPNFSNFFE